jgi:nicotinamide-nucleotide amidase
MVQSDDRLDALAQRVGERLRVLGWRIAIAESCTGGWLAKSLTDVPGSSLWFGWGFVTYANEAKTGMVGVPAALIAAHGAVSEPVVRAMAEGARARSGADVAVAISGIAGPHGATPGKPLGTVWFAWTGPHGTRAEHEIFAGGRERVRRQAVAHALGGILNELERVPA